MLASSRDPSDRIFFKAAGIAALVYVLSGPPAQFLHPFPADDDPTGFLEALTTTSYWTLIHLVNALGPGLALVVHLGLYRAVVGDVARFLATLGVAFAVIAVGFVAAWMAIDGVAMVSIGEDWRAAGGGDTGTAFQIATAVEDVIFGFFSIGWVLWFGIPTLLMGIAVALSEPTRAWMGWIGAVIGLAATGAGITQCYTGREFVVTDIWLPLTGISGGVWVAIMGLLIWSRSRRADA